MAHDDIDFDIIFEPEEDEEEGPSEFVGVFELESGATFETTARCPQCDSPFVWPTCDVCSMAWHIPTPPPTLQ